MLQFFLVQLLKDNGNRDFIDDRLTVILQKSCLNVWKTAELNRIYLIKGGYLLQKVLAILVKGERRIWSLERKD